MELLIIAYACKTSSARNIIGVIPYLPYSRHSKMRKRGCIVSKLLAKMMCKAGAYSIFVFFSFESSMSIVKSVLPFTLGLTHVLTIDLHSKEIQGFFDVPVDNLRASPFLLDHIRREVISFTVLFPGSTIFLLFKREIWRWTEITALFLDSRLSKCSDRGERSGLCEEGYFIRWATASWWENLLLFFPAEWSKLTIFLLWIFRYCRYSWYSQGRAGGAARRGKLPTAVYIRQHGIPDSTFHQHGLGFLPR